MPKIGMEPIRRKALIEATILEIGKVGALNVTVGKIAKRAGVSSALAHHYFGGKDQILLAAMRAILAQFGACVKHALSKAETPTDRIEAIIDACFHADNFQPHVVSSWLSFYVLAQTSADAQRLLRIYAHRLQSNLIFDLVKLTDRDKALHIANGLASIIDGFYIRQALQQNNADRADAISIVKEYFHMQLKDG